MSGANKEKDHYWGKDCPSGMIQVEFVGCNPKEKISEYGWKPCRSTFLEIYVDGERFRLDVGALNEHGVNGRGIHICGPMHMVYTPTAINAGCISIPKKDAPQNTNEGVETQPLTAAAQNTAAKE